MRLRVLLPLIIAVTGTVGLQRRDKDEDNLVQSYFDALIPVVTDTILHQNAGPGIGADVKNAFSVCWLRLTHSVFTSLV